jgi:hypothetical protein
MRTDSDSAELRDRITRLSDEQLLEMVEVEPEEYRAEALEFARVELKLRGIQFEQGGRVEEPVTPVKGPAPMRRLFTCKNIIDAGILRGLLTGNDIECETRGEYLSMAIGEIPYSECYPQLWVSDEDFERAKAILDQWQNREPVSHDRWTCKGCGEVNEGQFMSCWKCGGSETGRNDSTGS